MTQCSQLFLFCLSFSPVVFSILRVVDSKILALQPISNPLTAEVTAGPSSSAPSTHHPVHISPTLETSSTDIEPRGAADPRPPKQGGGREGGRWRSGWRPEKYYLMVPVGLVDRTGRGCGLAVPLSTKTPRKQAGKE